MKVWGVTGWKNSGKTGLVERLVAAFVARGLRVSTIKHAHAGFDIDQPGTDSARHRGAGAGEVLLASNTRWALMHELGDASEPGLDALLARLGPADLVLVEGFKSEAHPKIEAYRMATGQDLRAGSDPTIRAVASDSPISDAPVPVFSLDDTQALVDFIARELDL
ncbi:MAG: molybdopterin-guanine dinucleotide biosynthesis protein B [Pseudomonadota bacterium]